MPDARLVAHSLTEARLYLLVTRCPSCGKGPLRYSQARTRGVETHRSECDDARVQVTIDATCGECAAATSYNFELPAGLVAGNDEDVRRINATDEPSRIIDVAHWLTLFRMGAEEAGREPEKTQARELWIEVGQYLAEALKFYDDPDSDLPPEEAFFSKMSRERLRENPEQFSRQRLINLRARLPFPSDVSPGARPSRRPGEPR